MGLCGVVVMLSLCGFLTPALGEKHSLYNIYTALSKNVDLPGIYDFTAMGLLDDREIDYYNSKDQKKIPRQDWMREKMQEDYWEQGTQSRKSKEQWFKDSVDILMQRMRHNHSDLHVLQWRVGCEVDDTNGEIKYLSGIYEYGYDGSAFISFDFENMRWIAPVPAAEPTKRKWDDNIELKQYIKAYLEKECVDWLRNFMGYGKESLRKHTPPDVRVFAKKSLSDPKKLTLTCLVTGFYPKDMRLSVRKFHNPLPEHLLTSSGVRPNGDGTYQLRKSVDVQEEDTAGYDCYVTHVTFKEPIIKQWDGKLRDSSGGVGVIIGAVVGVLLVLGAVVGLIIFLIMKRRNDPLMTNGTGNGTTTNGNHYISVSNGTANVTNGTANVTNGTANGTNGTANVTNGTANVTNGTANGTNGTANVTNGTANVTNGTANGTNGTANGTNGTANVTNGTANGTNGTANGTLHFSNDS
ncbi:zinc-alpha-2-glycoprotein-like [Hoplias malabaricus]|uniref:zinc-alpha-2-glycoprotein-like n=1 Tax=Hoplias malabaricus TaxID=27720 RepID=UPI0034636DA7